MDKTGVRETVQNYSTPISYYVNIFSIHRHFKLQ